MPRGKWKDRPDVKEKLKQNSLKSAAKRKSKPKLSKVRQYILETYGIDNPTPYMVETVERQIKSGVIWKT